MEILGLNKAGWGIQPLEFNLKYPKPSLLEFDLAQFSYTTGDMSLSEFLYMKWDSNISFRVYDVTRELTSEEWAKGDYPDTALYSIFDCGLTTKNTFELAFKSSIIRNWLDISFGQRTKSDIYFNFSDTASIIDPDKGGTYTTYNDYGMPETTTYDAVLAEVKKDHFVGKIESYPFFAIHPHWLSRDSDGHIGGGIASTVGIGYKLLEQRPFFKVRLDIFSQKHQQEDSDKYEQLGFFLKYSQDLKTKKYKKVHHTISVGGRIFFQR